jgi:hypothetical protein
MDVGAQRCAYIGVSENVGNRAHINALGKHHGRGRVPQVVEADWSDVPRIKREYLDAQRLSNPLFAVEFMCDS